MTEEAPLKIAMLSVHSSPIGKLGTKDTGGMSVYVRELARELGNRGHQVDIFTLLRDGACESSFELSENVRLVHLRAGNNGHLHKAAIYPYLPDFFRDLERFRTREGVHYDLIHSHYWLSGRVGNWAQVRWCVPHLVKFHTLSAVKNSTAEAEQEPQLRVATEKRLAKTCHRIIAATEREREQLMRYYDVPCETIGMVPCGVNPELFRPMDRSTSRKRLGFDSDECIVLYVGRFAPVKGIDRLLTAMTYLKHHRRLRLVIVGGDGYHTPESQRLRTLTRRLGIEDLVTFAGRIEQGGLSAYYSAADVVVVPSHYESFGLVALEALACGTPVVATQVGAMESILREGETGHVVPNGSPRLLAEGLEAFIARPHAPSPHAIRESVLEFTWTNVASATIEEYSTVLRQHQVASDSSGTSLISLH